MSKKNEFNFGVVKCFGEVNAFKTTDHFLRKRFLSHAKK